MFINSCLVVRRKKSSHLVVRFEEKVGNPWPRVFHRWLHYLKSLNCCLGGCGVGVQYGVEVDFVWERWGVKLTHFYWSELTYGKKSKVLTYQIKLISKQKCLARPCPIRIVLVLHLFWLSKADPAFFYSGYFQMIPHLSHPVDTRLPLQIFERNYSLSPALFQTEDR